ncbi:MAG: hypothetical protein OHK0039_48910 [Bacteroidia bacterium]
MHIKPFSMKNLIPFLLLLFACKAEVPTPGGTMTARVNSADWSARISVVAVIQETSGVRSLQVAGNALDGTQIQLAVSSYTGPGTYQATGLLGSNVCTYTAGLSLDEVYSTQSGGLGTIVVATESTEAVSGTFTFEALNAGGELVTVTSGAFDADL